MSKNKVGRAGESDPEGENVQGQYTVYAAGGIFTQHDLTANVFIKEAVWKLSKGKYELVLPQSRELRGLDRADIAAYLRNVDLLQVVRSDILIARFDGLELDTGTVIEFIMAKTLGKPAVILRCDTRRLGGMDLDDPYNLMVKNWPRTTEVHISSLIRYTQVFPEEHAKMGNDGSYQPTIQAELKAVQKGIEEIAQGLVAGLEAALEMKSPFPPEYREMVYRAARYAPGGGFEKLLTEDELEGIIQRARKKGTL